MKRSLLNTSVFFWLALNTNLNAQVIHWLPIPFGQTSYFHTTHTGEVIPLKNDSVRWDANGLHGGVYEKLIHNGFGQCADTIYDQWDGLEYSPMIQSFERRGDTIEVQGRGWDFRLLLSADTGALLPFSGSLLSRSDSVGLFSFLDISDSVKYWSILFPDSNTVKAQIALSKSHGLIKIPDCKPLFTDSFPVADTRHYTLIGMEDSATVTMFVQPGIDTFYPYSPGDELFFYYEKFVWNAGESNVWERQYWYVSADSVGTKNGRPRLCGRRDRFHETRAIIALDEQFEGQWSTSVPGFDFTYPYHVPHPEGSMSSLRWKENELVREVHASLYDTSFCDWYIDGPFFTCVYSSDFGMMEASTDAGFQGHEFIKLMAAKVSGKTYGTWPN